MVKALVSEGVRFTLVGGAATATHYFAALTMLAMGVDVLIANLVGFALALAVSVVGHHHFSFPGRVSFFYGASRFIPAALVAFAVNILVLGALGHAAPSLPAWLRLTLAVGVMPIVTFFYARFYAYRARET